MWRHDSGGWAGCPLNSGQGDQHNENQINGKLPVIGYYLECSTLSSWFLTIWRKSQCVLLPYQSVLNAYLLNLLKVSSESSNFFVNGLLLDPLLHFACSAARSSCRPLHLLLPLSCQFLTRSTSDLFHYLFHFHLRKYHRCLSGSILWNKEHSRTWKEPVPNDHCSWTCAPVLYSSRFP